MSPTLNQFIGLSLHQGQCVLGKKRVGDLVSGFTMVGFNLAPPPSAKPARRSHPVDIDKQWDTGHLSLLYKIGNVN